MFLQLHRPPVLIDEVQYAPELFTYIKVHVDKNQEPGAFWLTGSQDTIDSLKFFRFITAVAARCGQMLNVADIAADADINQKKARDCLGCCRSLDDNLGRRFQRRKENQGAGKHRRPAQNVPFHGRSGCGRCHGRGGLSVQRIRAGGGCWHEGRL